MLDIDTLRIVQATVAACVFILVFFGTYVTTRAPYAGWWSGVVVVSSASSAMYLFAGLPWQSVTDAVGQGLAPVAATFALAAARSLRTKTTVWWWLYAPGVVVFAIALVDSPDDQTLPGTWALLTAMTALFTMTARELWLVSQENDARYDREIAAGTRASILFVAGASTLVAAFYGFRLAAYLAVGPADAFYRTWAGPVATTMIILIMLIVVTYTVSGLSQLELSHEWRRRASLDDLTGLLGRGAFMERAAEVLDRARADGRYPTAILADFDHFKVLNDDHGHAAGDRALEAFGDACRRLLAADDLACRMGGEEFVLLSSNVSATDAEDLTKALSTLFAELVGPEAPCPTVSYGIASVDETWSLDAAIRRADEAMYRAKRSGRNRATIFRQRDR